MQKSDLRKKYKSLRTSLSLAEIETLSIQIANQCLSLPIWHYTYYHLFLTILKQKEVDTSPLLNILQGKDKQILLPKSDFDSGQMTSYLLTDNTRILPNTYGIPEPQGGLTMAPDLVDVIFIPLLAFDLRGHRVGYGKGFYDRFLERCKPDVLKIGLSFFDAEDRIEDEGSHDITLDICVTPHKLYVF